MGQRERRQAIEAPVSEADKLLAELESADTETRLSILISGWGRGLAAGLEELALAVDDLHQHPSAAPISTPTPSTPSQASRPSPTEDRSAQSHLGDASEEQLVDEARQSLEATAEMRKETEEARRELEP